MNQLEAEEMLARAQWHLMFYPADRENKISRGILGYLRSQLAGKDFPDLTPETACEGWKC